MSPTRIAIVETEVEAESPRMPRVAALMLASRSAVASAASISAPPAILRRLNGSPDRGSSTSSASGSVSTSAGPSQASGSGGSSYGTRSLAMLRSMLAAASSLSTPASLCSASAELMSLTACR